MGSTNVVTLSKCRVDDNCWNRWYGFYAWKQNASRVFAIICLSVCPSVCLFLRLSHSWSVSKRCKLGSRNLPCVLPHVFSLSRQNFVPLGEGVPLERGHRRGVPPPPKKDVILPLLARIMWKQLQIGTYVLLIITSTGDRLFGFINIDDLERPWTPQKEVFSEFLAIFVCSAHFNTELRQNGWR